MAPGLVLATLGPRYDSDQHQVYVEILLRALAEKGPQAPKNIALTGHYGTGKSSVLAEVQHKLKHRAVSLTLASLGSPTSTDSGRSKEADAAETTNRIQKEIVKQLLYRRQSAHLPESRYRRIERFRYLRALGWSALVVVVVAAIGLWANALNHLEASLPDHFRSDHGAAFTAIAVGMLVLVGAVVFVLQRAFHNRLWIEKLAAGPASISLTNGNDTYFDQYLDEIVYFFRVSRCRVAILEDLDRFHEPHIFETLRELNLLLNNSDELRNKRRGPIRFVYAIRDSVFDATGTSASDGVTDGDPLEDGPTNRTKFFDLIVPMVPFITHRTSRNLVAAEFRDVTNPPSADVVRLVAGHITDMRLIKNIRNEYQVFSQRVLPPAGLKELKPDQLFAMLAYKNLHMADFEQVRRGKSRIDDVYRASRDLVTQVAATADRDAARARAQLATIEAISPRSARHGERLAAILKALAASLNLAPSGGPWRITFGTDTYDLPELVKPEFWSGLLAAGQPLQVNFPSNNRVGFSLDVLATLMGEELRLKDWRAEDEADLQNGLAAAIATRQSVTHADVWELIANGKLAFDYEGSSTTLSAIAKDRMPSALAHELLTAGFIDRNYALYVAQFTGSSPSATNFVLHSIEPNQTDAYFHFESDSDIEAVLAEQDEAFLRERSAYNIELIDFLLARDDKRAEAIVEALAASGPDADDFIYTYLQGGRRKEEFIAMLAQHSGSVFLDLAHFARETGVAPTALLNAALVGSDPQVRYSSDDEVRALVRELYPELSILTQILSIEYARKAVGVLDLLGVVVDDLTPLSPAARSEVVERRLYPLTDSNIAVALGNHELGLDAIKKNPDVYGYVLRQMGEYLSLLAADPSANSVSDPAEFAGIVTDVATAAGDAIEPVITRASPECVVADISSEVPPETWPILARAGRLAVSVANIRAYQAESPGVDEHLAALLSSHDALTGVDGHSQRDRRTVALSLLNSSRLSAPTKVSLLESLELEKPLDLEAIEPAQNAVLPMLVGAGLVADDAAVFERLVDEQWSVKLDLIARSSAFMSYLPSLDLAPDDRSRLASDKDAPAEAKRYLLENITFLAAGLDQRAMRALAGFALGRRMTLPAHVLVTLASGGADATAVVGLLDLTQDAIHIKDVNEILQLLGVPYASLTEIGYNSDIHIPGTQVNRRLLARLQSDGIVSSVREDDKHGDFRVRVRLKRRA